MSEVLSPPEPGYGIRTVCTRCDNTGAVIELRVIWKQPRTGLPPLRGSRRVTDDDEARLAMDEAGAAGYIDIEFVTAARPCECRKQPCDPPRPAGRPKGSRELRPPLPSNLDFKRRAGGDHDEELTC